MEKLGKWREMSGKALEEWIDQATDSVTVFFYTPTCGNCKVARRVVDAAMAHVAADVTVIGCNLNFMPQAAVTWKIERIPALFVLRQGQVYRKTYDFSSPDPLSNWLVRQDSF